MRLMIHIALVFLSQLQLAKAQHESAGRPVVILVHGCCLYQLEPDSIARSWLDALKGAQTKLGLKDLMESTDLRFTW